jgi:hypothetical protein
MLRREFFKWLGGGIAALLRVPVMTPDAPRCKHCGKPIRLVSFNGIPVFEHTPHRQGSHFPDTACHSYEEVEAGVVQTHATNVHGSRGFITKEDGSPDHDFYRRQGS